ncbi:RNA-directed DNA polymerase from mobile element jockey-like [Brachionus plicatilis]|uniref:RNA-directed DNA polymerase from mobile element jockey-like n=1 Tax=Brachionus plicatilis TaxID=10195 RepID=A0A3M7S326_BRAPC|nr:RNA-directed DNA polymerase from mobile element jockey-like [Brachionus plicatilis]
MRRRAPWMTPAVKVLTKNKRDLWHKNQASKWKIRSLVLEYKKCRQDVKRICRSTIRNYESELASDKKNPKRLFAYIYQAKAPLDLKNFLFSINKNYMLLQYLEFTIFYYI